MATKRLPRPRDPLQLGKLIVDIATGEVEDAVEDGKNLAAIERGSKGGKAGGRARALNLTAEQRSEIAQLAANTRWKKGNYSDCKHAAIGRGRAEYRRHR